MVRFVEEVAIVFVGGHLCAGLAGFRRFGGLGEELFEELGVGVATSAGLDGIYVRGKLIDDQDSWYAS